MPLVCLGRTTARRPTRPPITVGTGKHAGQVGWIMNNFFTQS
jgi:hypothetical protein